MLRNCVICSKEFKAKPYEVKAGHARFCSAKCKAVFQIGRELPKKLLKDRFWSKVLKTDTCWLWQGFITKKGYGYFGVGNGKNDHAHRVSYRLTYGEFDNKLQVLHKCDNPPCVRPDHLFLGTNSDNYLDKLAKNRQAKQRGEKNPNAKLSLLQVEAIRKIKGKSQTQIAKEYNVSQTLISKIRLKQIW
jgi:hypothetical protein